MDYFFYGTLMDGDVLARVVGQPVPPARMEAAVVDGYRRLYVAGAWYPMLVPAPGGRVEGRLVSGIDAAQAARIANFESDAYELEALPVRRRGAARSGPSPTWPAPVSPPRPRNGIWRPGGGATSGRICVS